MKLVLASSSPRRRELLPLLGLPFEVIEPEVEELTTGDPREVVAANAELKARAGAGLAGPGATVLGADTDVVLNGLVLGKPADEAEARARLRSLAGRDHEVHSGVYVVGPAGARSGTEATTVGFRRLGDDEIDAYVATGEWRGRAGGYAVQGYGSSLIASVDGDLSNVIGLPLPLVARLVGDLQTS